MRSLFAVLVSLFAVLPAWAASVPVSSRISQTLDVRYYPGTDRHTLDVFSPAARAGDRFPVVLFVHGGSWMVGDKNFFGVYRGIGQSLARQGVVAVLINYRLSPQVRHPEHVRDVARAFAWTVRNIDRHAGDPDQIILAGHSAGGHLATLLATDPSYLDDAELKLLPRQRKAIRGVASLCGVYRVPEPAEFRQMADRIIDHLVKNSASPEMARVLGPTLRWASVAFNPFHLVFGTNTAVRFQASPITHVQPGLPPFLLYNSQWEVPGLWQMAVDFTEELKKNGVSVEHKVVEQCTHRTIVKLLHDENESLSREVLQFVQRHTSKPRGDRS